MFGLYATAAIFDTYDRNESLLIYDMDLICYIDSLALLFMDEINHEYLVRILSLPILALLQGC